MSRIQDVLTFLKSSSWQDPTFSPGGSAPSPGGGSAPGSGGLPWWANAPHTSPTKPGSGMNGTPPALGTPGYQDFGPHGGKPDYGADNPGGYGADPGLVHADHTGEGFHLNSHEAGQLAGFLSGLAGVPGSGVSQVVSHYATQTGNDNPFPQHNDGVTVTDMNNPQPQFTIRGYGSDPYGGGFGQNYYGQDNNNGFSNDAQDWWTTMQPGQGIGGGGAGGLGGGFTGGGGGNIYSGTASPWDWGDSYSY